MQTPMVQYNKFKAIGQLILEAQLTVKRQARSSPGLQSFPKPIGLDQSKKRFQGEELHWRNNLIHWIFCNDPRQGFFELRVSIGRFSVRHVSLIKSIACVISNLVLRYTLCSNWTSFLPKIGYLRVAS